MSEDELDQQAEAFDDEENEDKPWVIRGVRVKTRQAVKLYAVEHNMTIARALERMVNLAQQRIEDVAAKRLALKEADELLKDRSLLPTGRCSFTP